MRTKIFSGLIILVFLTLNLSCGVQFMKLSLEDQNLKEIDGFAEFEASSVYRNTTGDEVWGMEKDACKDLDFSTGIAKDGQTALKLDWNKVGCDWVGFGIGWNAWQPKDLTNIMETGALEFYIRSIEGETNIPLLILLLEDYATVMSAAVFRPKHLENYPLDENWNRAVVPLKEFDVKESGVDLSNIKQLVIELQGSGKVLMDEISIIPYVPSEKSSSPHKPSITQLNSLPRILFEDTLLNVWGLEANTCRDFNYSSETAYAGTRSIKLSWDLADTCKWVPFGFSWNKWLGVDINPVVNNAALSFYIKMEEGNKTDLPLYVGLQDYETYGPKTSYIPLIEKYVSSGTYNTEWQQVIIPLDEFKFEEKQINTGNIKQILFDVKNSGAVWIDEISLIDIPSG